MNSDLKMAPAVAPETTTDQQALQRWDQPDSNWNIAAMQTPQADPFCCRTEWQLSYHEAMEPDRELLVREEPGSVVAFAELNLARPGHWFGPLESHWLFGCPLLGPDAVELLDDLLGGFATPADEPSPHFVISGLESGGALQKKIVSTMASRFGIMAGQPTLLCSASLEGGLDGFLARRSAKHRRGLGKQARKAAGLDVSFERHAPANPTEAAHIYARMLAVEEASWKGIGECGMTVMPSRFYYDCMLRRLSVSGRARVIFARQGEQDIGYIFGSLADKVYRGQQFSYADDWKSFSIGNLLQLEQIKWLCEENIERYDMGPMMEYKKHWTEIVRPIRALVLRRRPPQRDVQYRQPL